jgi:hypothetical protein
MSQKSPSEMPTENDEEEPLTCVECGEPRPPGPELCPVCEDKQSAVQFAQAPPGAISRGPPHGNTTR